MKIIFRLFILSVLNFVTVSCENKSSKNENNTKSSLDLKYSLLSTFPHNEKAFTEGLVIYNNKLLESTGQNNQSWIAEVDEASGEHIKKVILDGQYFGEGITVLNKKSITLHTGKKSVSSTMPLPTKKLASLITTRRAGE